MTKKIDITSTTVEKGLDLAKDFLDKLIIPSVEETGLLLKDKVTFWKFKNQVRTLNKAKAFCEKNNVSPKTISLKLLCPLLDYSALEENEELQDKWAILLTNMVDSTQNIENHVFPYILSQISSTEFSLLENVYDDKVIRQEKLKNELSEFEKGIPHVLEKIKKEVAKLEGKIEILREQHKNKQGWIRDVWKLEREKTKLENEPKTIERMKNQFKHKISEPQTIPEEELKEFEISNLIRLGLIRFVQKPYAHSQTLEIPYENDLEYSGLKTYTNIDLNIEIDSEEEYVQTELGELFIKACKLNE